MNEESFRDRSRAGVDLGQGSGPLHSEEVQLTERGYQAFLRSYSNEVSRTLQEIRVEPLVQAVDVIYSTRGRNQVFIAGNGGSATIADHFAQNINWDVSVEVPRSEKCSARCLNIEGAEITARGNDGHFAYSFASMLDTHAKSGDVFVGISASGESDDIVKAFIAAKKIGLTTIFIGKPKSSAEGIADVSITVDSDDQQIIEDVSQSVIHMMVRALRVRLTGLNEEDLLTGIAHLRTKVIRIEAMSAELGEPVENQVRDRRVFENALVRFAEGRIERATRVAFPDQEPYLIEPFASDFTSFIRRITAGDQTYFAKFSLGATKPRLIFEKGSMGALGLAEVALMDSQAVSEEFYRTQYLHSIFPDNIPQPHRLIDSVAFYTFVRGRSLEQMMLDGDTPPMAKVGRLLKDWHDFFRINEPSEEIGRFCGGDLDRIRRYKTRYSTPEGLQNAFQPLINNGCLEPKSSNLVLSLLSRAILRLNNSGVLDLERDTWGHGDFKPENVILTDQSEIIFVDNDFHQKPAVVDVAKMISRSLALCFDGSCNPDKIADYLSEFTAGYTTEWSIPPYLAEIVAIDMIAILAGYSTISPDLLDQSPHLAQIFLRAPQDVVGFIAYLTTREHRTLSSIAEYFHSPTVLSKLAD